MKLDQLSNSEKSDLLRAADESSYSLEEWTEAFQVLDLWFQKNSRQASFADQLAYIRCCCDSSQAPGVAYPLKSLVQEMLDEHGFERSLDLHMSSRPKGEI